MKFKEYSFKDLLIEIVDNRGKTCPTADDGIPLIATNCIKNDALYPVFEKVRYVDSETYNNWFRGHPQPGDMIFVCKGSPGRVVWVPDPVNFCIAQDMVAIRADESKVYPKYLFALLRSEKIQQKILNMHVGTLIPHFKKGDFKNLYLEIPEDTEYQKKVGDVYHVFCEKIDNNLKINQTLEKIAQAIFKSWFVNFEPVKAKIQAKQNGHDPERAAMRAISGKTDEELEELNPEQRQQLAETAVLFPSELEGSEIGEIPKGWEVKPLDKIAEYLNGLALQKYPADEDEESLPVIKIAQLKAGNSKGAGRASRNIKPEYIIDNSDVIFSWSGSLFVDIWCGGEGALNQHLFKVTSKQYPKWFYYYWTKHHLAEFIRIAADKAVTMGHIKRGHLSTALCVVPDSKIIPALGPHIESVLNACIEKRLENTTLSKIRDSLLPKLLSGEIAISNTKSKEEAIAI